MNFHDLKKPAEFIKNDAKICFSCYKLSKELKNVKIGWIGGQNIDKVRYR